MVRNGIVTLSLFPEPMDQDYACPNFKTPDFFLFFFWFFCVVFFIIFLSWFCFQAMVPNQPS